MNRELDKRIKQKANHQVIKTYVLDFDHVVDA
jgi:hypothetical protein